MERQLVGATEAMREVEEENLRLKRGVTEATRTESQRNEALEKKLAEERK